MQREFAIIIPFFQGEKLITDCIQSISESTVSGKIYVIDNDYDDFITDMDVQVIKTKPSLGFGRAVNIGLHEAHSDGYRIFIVLNQDTKLKSDALELLLNQIDDTSVVVPSYYDADFAQPEKHFLDYFLNGEIENNFTSIREKQKLEITRANAACIGFNNFVLEKLGGFDPIFKMYGEDDDFFTRLKARGSKIQLIPKAKVYHVHSLLSTNTVVKNKVLDWQATSENILDIRYNNQSVPRTIIQFLRLAGHKSKGLPDLFYILKNWSIIKNKDIGEIRKRINSFIHQDRIN